MVEDKHCHCEEGCTGECACADQEPNLFEEESTAIGDILMPIFEETSSSIESTVPELLKNLDENNMDKAKTICKQLLETVTSSPVYKVLFSISHFINIQSCYDEIEDGIISNEADIHEMISAMEDQIKLLKEDAAKTNKKADKEQINKNIKAFETLSEIVKGYSEEINKMHDSMSKPESDVDSTFINEFKTWYFSLFDFSGSLAALEEPFKKIYAKFFEMRLCNKAHAESLLEAMKKAAEDSLKQKEEEDKEILEDAKAEGTDVTILPDLFNGENPPHFVSYLLNLCEIEDGEDDELIELKSNIDVEAYSEMVVKLYKEMFPEEKEKAIKSIQFVEYLDDEYYNSIEKLSLFFDFLSTHLGQIMNEMLEVEDVQELVDTIPTWEKLQEIYDEMHESFMNEDFDGMGFGDDDFDDEDDYDDEYDDDEEEDDDDEEGEEDDDENNDQDNEEANYKFTY
ncbi:hypothetical protein WA158_000896 [Blastocystis sp. Blastoise]